MSYKLLVYTCHCMDGISLGSYCLYGTGEWLQ